MGRLLDLNVRSLDNYLKHGYQFLSAENILSILQFDQDRQATECWQIQTKPEDHPYKSRMVNKSANSYLTTGLISDLSKIIEPTKEFYQFQVAKLDKYADPTELNTPILDSTSI